MCLEVINIDDETETETEPEQANENANDNSNTNENANENENEMKTEKRNENEKESDHSSGNDTAEIFQEQHGGDQVEDDNEDDDDNNEDKDKNYASDEAYEPEIQLDTEIYSDESDVPMDGEGSDEYNELNIQRSRRQGRAKASPTPRAKASPKPRPKLRPKPRPKRKSGTGSVNHGETQSLKSIQAQGRNRDSQGRFISSKSGNKSSSKKGGKQSSSKSTKSTKSPKSPKSTTKTKSRRLSKTRNTGYSLRASQKERQQLEQAYKDSIETAKQYNKRRNRSNRNKNESDVESDYGLNVNDNPDRNSEGSDGGSSENEALTSVSSEYESLGDGGVNGKRNRKTGNKNNNNRNKNKTSKYKQAAKKQKLKQIQNNSKNSTTNGDNDNDKSNSKIPSDCFTGSEKSGKYLSPIATIDGKYTLKDLAMINITKHKHKMRIVVKLPTNSYGGNRFADKTKQVTCHGEPPDEAVTTIPPKGKIPGRIEWQAKYENEEDFPDILKGKMDKNYCVNVYYPISKALPNCVIVEKQRQMNLLHGYGAHYVNIGIPNNFKYYKKAMSDFKHFTVHGQGTIAGIRRDIDRFVVSTYFLNSKLLAANTINYDTDKVIVNNKLPDIIAAGAEGMKWYSSEQREEDSQGLDLLRYWGFNKLCFIQSLWCDCLWCDCLWCDYLWSNRLWSNRLWCSCLW